MVTRTEFKFTEHPNQKEALPSGRAQTPVCSQGALLPFIPSFCGLPSQTTAARSASRAAAAAAVPASTACHRVAPARSAARKARVRTGCQL